MLVSTILAMLPFLSTAVAAPTGWTCRFRNSTHSDDTEGRPVIGRPSFHSGNGNGETSSAFSTSTSTSDQAEETVATTTVIGDNNAAAPPPTSTPPAASPSPTSGSGGGSGGSGNADQDLFLSLHNDFRAKYGAGPLTWNQELADFAQGVANTCKMVHSEGAYGENLASGAGGGYDINKGFNGWANEASMYNWGAPGFQMSTGHFTQVVWKATTELGCAVAKCADGTLFTGYGEGLNVVCEYKSGGNVVGNNGQYFRENVGTLVG